MKKGTYALIIALIFLVLIAATAASFLFIEFGRPPSLKTPSYLEIELDGPVQDLAPTDFFSQMFLGMKPLSIHDVWINLKKAKNDNRIQAVLLRLGFLYCDWGKVSEIRDAVLEFRTSGKKVYAYVEESPEFDKEYYLATACDRIILHPLGWFGINGIGGYVPFFKKALDKLGVKAEFEHIEEYKTAYNMFTEDRFTPAHREMDTSIYGDIFAEYIKTVAAARKKSEEEVRRLIDRGFFYGDSALKEGLVDELLYEDGIESLIQGTGGKVFKISLNEYNRIKPVSPGKTHGHKIALIYGQGAIISGESFPQMMGGRTVSRWIRKAREDDSLSAIIFRVDSPGGSAVASDVIGREVILARKRKPLVVSMSDMAGSGGYWISMSAHKIIAQPQTLTGSIGVISGKFDFSGLYDKLGITGEKLSFGEKADIFSTFRRLKPEERKLLQEQNRWFYERFLERVAEGRNMTKERVNEIGRGRVWTGRQAREIGLVDELGGLSKAVEIAKKLAGIPQEEEVRLVVWPKKISFFETLFGRRKDEAFSVKLPRRLEKAFSWLEMLNKEKVWAVMPFWPAVE